MCVSDSGDIDPKNPLALLVAERTAATLSRREETTRDSVCLQEWVFGRHGRGTDEEGNRLRQIGGESRPLDTESRARRRCLESFAWGRTEALGQGVSHLCQARSARHISSELCKLAWGLRLPAWGVRVSLCHMRGRVPRLGGGVPCASPIIA